MNIDKLFVKPIDRFIEGVIKADDEGGLCTEVEEYVLTDEVGEGLQDFLDEYNRDTSKLRTVANGVWISGFFGSGKSHLLKILAMLLENRNVGGKSLIDLFLPKCKNNPLLTAALKKAVSIPSRSILFNIDQKATIVSKESLDALLGVFAKVFDDMCGYFGNQGHIAQFERDLDKRGQYGAFKKAYREISGRDWSSGREQAVLETENIARAYENVSGAGLPGDNNILDRYRSQYKLSIEDFARNVNDFVVKQGPRFRLNFFVDEVGQYIAGNIKLMTNLQTIAESLASQCGGRAWLLVTAQEDMEQVIGQMQTASANDFSKIADRFKYKLKLTSKNVAEVIQKRLLLKNDSSRVALEEIYETQRNNFRTLFDFSDGSVQYINYRDKEHFVQAYPFVPYQFELFQQSIMALSNHNAFEGRHRSVGERSLLAVFQHVARSLSRFSTGTLAPLHLMFDGIRGTLKSRVQHSILMAEEYLRNPFAVQVLKVLFIVKYIKGFKASIRNIQVLLTEKFDEDVIALRQKIENVLDLLERKSYIHRDGDFYQYLTDEEKDMEEAIKNQEIEHNEIKDELTDIIYNQVIKQKKIRFQNGRDFPFSCKLDDRVTGRKHELAIHIISPFYTSLEQENTILLQAMANDELLILMPSDERLVHDLSMSLKTRKFIRLHSTASLQESVQSILKEKQKREEDRLLNVKSRIRDLLKGARMYVGGKLLELKAEDPVARVTAGFFQLIERTYINLPMLKGITFNEKDLRKNLQPRVTDDYTEAQQHMMAEITRNQAAGRLTSILDLYERFDKKPYGWELWDTLCIVAKLWSGGKIELTKYSQSMENEKEIDETLRNTKQHASIHVTPMAAYSGNQVRLLKRFYDDYFSETLDGEDARGLAKAALARFETEKKEIDDALKEIETRHFPFGSLLNKPLEFVSNLTQNHYSYFLTGLHEVREQLLGLKQEVISPIMRFINGKRGEIYEKALQFHQRQEPNYRYLPGPEHRQLAKILEDRECFRNNRMQKADTLMKTIEKQIADIRRDESEKARKILKEKQALLTRHPDFQTLSPGEKDQMVEPFETLIHSFLNDILISNIRDKPRHFLEKDYPRILEKLNSKTIPEKKPIALGKVKVNYETPYLKSPPDITNYLKKLEIALLTELEKGNYIHL